MNLRTFEGLPLKGRKVLVRVDFNVPLLEGRVADDTRIMAHLQTIKLLRDGEAKIVLVSHLGRPKGKREGALSLKPVADFLCSLTGWNVHFIDYCIGEIVSSAVDKMLPGDIALMENVRFYKEEEDNDKDFSREMAKPFDLFVMDAFSASHRAHASTRGIMDFLPSFAGKVMEKEVAILGSVREKPVRPLVLILGGAKVSDKIRIISYMLSKSSHIIIGGAMAFPFLKASGYGIGGSFCEEGTEDVASGILADAKKAGVEIFLPLDFIVSDSKHSSSKAATVRIGEIPADRMGLDVGPLTVASFTSVLKQAKTVIWNGPLGVFEYPPFSEGTRSIGLEVSRITAEGAITVLGGGDTAAAANTLGFSDGIFHISTGGGATLEFLEGRDLPGITPLLSEQDQSGEAK